MPEVAPSVVQTRTMSRIESTPTASPASKTTRWRTPRRDISAAARSRLQSGRGGDHALAHVVGDQLDVGVLAAADRDQQVALGDDPRRRRLGVADQRGPGSLLDHHRGGLAQRVRRARRSATPPTSRPSPASAASSRRRYRDSADRRKTTPIATPDRTLSRRPRHIDSGPPPAVCEAPRNSSARCSSSPPWPASSWPRPAAERPAPTPTRGRVLFVAEVRRLPHPRRRRDHGPDRPRPRRRLRRRPRSRREQRHDRRDRQGPGREPAPGQRQPGGLDAGRHRQRPGPRRRRRLRRQVRRRARRGAAESARRPRRPGLRQQRLRRLPHASPPPNRAASPAPTSTKSCPARARRWSTSRSSTRTSRSPRATRRT